MKQIVIASYGHISLYILFFAFLFSVITGCKKEDSVIKENKATSSNSSNATNACSYSADVIDKWLTMQIRLDRDAIGIPHVAFSRYYAYTGLAAFAALAPGTDVGASFNGKLNGLSSLPKMDNSSILYWPASVNTAVAFMNRNMFTTATYADKKAIDSLENVLNNSFLSKTDPAVIALSNAFGKAVATAIFNWSETDGYKNASNPYTPPVGPGLWVPTPPSFAPASTPYWGNNRPIIAGDIDNTQPGAPVAYSEKPGSPFYQMAYHVYWISHHLTPADSAQAFFWRDLPGVTAFGHSQSILQEVIRQTHSKLDKAAFAYALTGICSSDACISC